MPVTVDAPNTLGRGRFVLAAALALIATGTMAQSQSIILNTTPTPTAIPLLDGTDVTVDPLSGDLTATPQDPAACAATADCSEVDVSITTFTVSPSTVSQGQTVSFQWNARGAWECQGSNLATTTWNGTKLPTGSQSVSTSSLSPATYTAILDCNNGPVTDSSQVNFTVTTAGGGGGGGGPQFCSDNGRLPPAGLDQDTQIIVGSSTTTNTWQQLFSATFPNGNGRDTSIQRDRYAALSFNSGSLATGTSGRVLFDVLQTTIPSGFKIVTISECPGDFTTALSSGCRRFFGQDGIRWSINTGGGFDCILSPNTDYYLNVVYTLNDTAPYDDWACSGASNPTTAAQCGDIMSPVVN